MVALIKDYFKNTKIALRLSSQMIALIKVVEHSREFLKS